MTMLFAYLGVLGWSFLGATVLPGGSEVALAALVRTEQAWVLPVLVATLGNYLGACTTYWLGHRAAHLVPQQPAVPMQHGRAAQLLRRYGTWALILSWVPIVGDALVALAGAMQIPFGRFSAWVMLGKGARYLVIAWATLMVA